MRKLCQSVWHWFCNISITDRISITTLAINCITAIANVCVAVYAIHSFNSNEKSSKETADLVKEINDSISMSTSIQKFSLYEKLEKNMYIRLYYDRKRSLRENIKDNELRIEIKNNNSDYVVKHIYLEIKILLNEKNKECTLPIDIIEHIPENILKVSYIKRDNVVNRSKLMEDECYTAMVDFSGPPVMDYSIGISKYSIKEAVVKPYWRSAEGFAKQRSWYHTPTNLRSHVGGSTMSVDYDYPTDLSDAQWELLQSLLPERKWRPGGPGRPPCDVRRIVNGILYINKTGCQWRLVPREVWSLEHYLWLFQALATRWCLGTRDGDAAPVGAPLPGTKTRALCREY